MTHEEKLESQRFPSSNSDNLVSILSQHIIITITKVETATTGISRPIELYDLRKKQKEGEYQPFFP